MNGKDRKAWQKLPPTVSETPEGMYVDSEHQMIKMMRQLGKVGLSKIQPRTSNLKRKYN